MMPRGSSSLLRFARLIHRDDGGTAAVSFILCLPIFLTIVGIIVQYALLLNAKMMVTNAAAAAGRAAMTSLPEEVPENVKKAACFMLVPISPKAGVAVTTEGQDIADALTSLGAKASPDFASRYTYAQQAVDVSYPTLDYKYLHGQDIEVTVRYKFYLTVPFAMGILSPGTSNVAGVNGRFFTIESKVRVQTAHGRGAASDNTGWAQ